MRPLIAVVGNTGVGKSQLAVEIARAFKGEIINADAMQMYKGVEIITNKHPLNEQFGVAHHLLGTEEWSDLVTVQDFERKASAKISEMHSSSKLPVVVGGTHYYIQSLIAENALVSPESGCRASTAAAAPAAAKRALTDAQLSVLNDPKQVEEQLAACDPKILQKFHPNDTRRTRRALEIFFETGEKPSSIYARQIHGDKDEQMRLRYRVLVLWVWCDQAVLNERLDARVDRMVEGGLMDELNEIYERYDGKNEGIFQVLGFKQFLPYLASGCNDRTLYEQGLNSMKTETRQYAKKQRKWIKNKLSQFVYRLGGDFAIADATNLSDWSTNVSARTQNIVRKWLDNNISSEELIPQHLRGEVVRSRQEFDQSQWTRYHCEACSQLRGRDVTLVGDADWKMHTDSKSHRSANYRLQRLKMASRP